MAFQTWTSGQVLTAAQLTEIQQIQYEGNTATVGTGGLTITFAVGRFTNTPIVTALGGHNTASGADPTGFVFIPFGGGPSTSQVILKTTATTQRVSWHAMNTNI